MGYDRNLQDHTQHIPSPGLHDNLLIRYHGRCGRYTCGAMVVGIVGNVVILMPMSFKTASWLDVTVATVSDL